MNSTIWHVQPSNCYQIFNQQTNHRVEQITVTDHQSRTAAWKLDACSTNAWRWRRWRWKLTSRRVNRNTRSTRTRYYHRSHSDSAIHNLALSEILIFSSLRFPALFSSPPPFPTFNPHYHSLFLRRELCLVWSPLFISHLIEDSGLFLISYFAPSRSKKLSTWRRKPSNGFDCTWHISRPLIPSQLMMYCNTTYNKLRMITFGCKCVECKHKSTIDVDIIDWGMLPKRQSFPLRTHLIANVLTIFYAQKIKIATIQQRVAKEVPHLTPQYTNSIAT